jgi:methyl-accepting chemotaxis protein
MTFTGGAMAKQYPSGPSEDQHLLQESLDLVAPVADELIAAFHDRLFTVHPELRPIFPPVLDRYRDRLVAAILALVSRYDRPQLLLPELGALGRRYDRYGLGSAQYAAIGSMLIGTLRDFAGPGWTPAHHGAWVRAYTFAAGCMMQAGALADEDRRVAA